MKIKKIIEGLDKIRSHIPQDMRYVIDGYDSILRESIDKLYELERIYKTNKKFSALSPEQTLESLFFEAPEWVRNKVAKEGLNE